MGLFLLKVVKVISWVFVCIIILGVFNPYQYYCSSIITWNYSFSLCSPLILVQYMVAFLILSISQTTSRKILLMMFVLLTVVTVALVWARNEFNFASLFNIVLYYIWGVLGFLLVFFIKNKYLSLLILFLIILGITMLAKSSDRVDLIKMFLLWGGVIVLALFYEKKVLIINSKNE